MTNEALVKRIVDLIPTHPRILDMSVDSLKVLRELGITWEELKTVTRGEMIDARVKAVERYNMLRVKFNFDEESYDKILQLGAQEGVSTGEIVRRALSLYVNMRNALRAEERITVTRKNMGQI